MAKLNTTTIQDITLKMALGVNSSVNSKNYFEETDQWTPQLDLSNIFAQTIPVAANPAAADANVTANPTMLVKLTNYVMDMIPASNGEGYGLYTTPGDTNSVRLTNFVLPQKYGNGYAFSLEENGTPVALTAGSYVFNYGTGVLRFNDLHTPATMGWTNLTITVYRYIGNLLSDITLGGGASAADSWRQPATVLDITNTSLTGWLVNPIVDGETLVDGDIVLFTNLTAPAENNRKYTWDNTGLTFTLVEDGQNIDGSPEDGDKLIIQKGTANADRAYTFNGTAWVQTQSFNLSVGEADGSPMGTNIDTILLAGGHNVYADGSTAYLHAPAPPVAIDIDNTITEYTGRLSQSNVNYKGADPAGSDVNYITRSTDIPNTNTFTSVVTSFNNASTGLLVVTVNGVAVASMDLAANFNELNRSGSQVIADYDIQGAGDPITDGVVPFVGGATGYGNLTLNSVNWTGNIPADVYQQGSCTINVTNSALFRQGYNTVVVSRGVDNSNTYELFYDTDSGGNPSVNSQVLTVDTPVIKNISGIPYLDTGSTLDLDGVVSDAFDNVYHSSNAPVVISNFPGMVATAIPYTDGSVSGISSPPDLTEAMTIANYTLTVVAEQEEEDTTVILTPRDPYGSYATAETASNGISIMSVNASSDATTENFVDENYRFPRTTNFNVIPISPTGNWTSATSLSGLTSELQYYDEDATVKRCLAHPSISYATGRNPVGPDYTGLAAGTNYDAHRIFIGTIDNSNGILAVPGLTDADLSSNNVQISIKVPTKTDWLSLNGDYNLGTFTDGALYVSTVWTTSGVKVLGDWIIPTVANGYKYKCTVAGTTDGVTEPTFPTTVGNTVVDGTVTWECWAIDAEPARINPGVHSPNIDGSIEFTLGTYASDASVNRYLFVKVAYASNTESGSLQAGFGITNW